MRTSKLLLLASVLVASLAGCGGGGGGSDAIGDIAQDMGWNEIPVKILEVGYLAEPGMLNGVCVIGIQAPGDAELAGTIWPEQAPVFKHIGDSVAKCLAGTVQTLFSLPQFYGVYLDQLVRVDYDADVDECGQQLVGGCYQDWADLALVLPDRLLGLVGLDASYEELESVVVGHEIWHMVAGNFHS